jgi:membrane-bound lytic murein transglycosylase D
VRRTFARLSLLPLVIALAGCVTEPAASSAVQRQRPNTSIVRPPLLAPLPAPAPEPVVVDFWDQVRGSFQMDDCDADSGIASWAHTYTSRPDRFESQLAAVLPLIEYAHGSAMDHHVAGEFALLPWIESQFTPVKAKKGRPAGMWQIVPATARSLGLRVNKNYDGRLDTAASTDAVMKMLAHYHDDLNDWRLVDIAFNSGEFGVRKQIEKSGIPPTDPAVPRMPMKAVTREHLVKLLAIACVIRDPERFRVSLPKIDKTRSLQEVHVASPQTLTQAAEQSSMPLGMMLALNPGHASADTTVSKTLLMPAAAADVYRDAVEGGRALTTTPTSTNADTTTAPASSEADKSGSARTVKVGKGDSLRSIARKYSVTVQQLVSWNHLSSREVRKGQTIRVVPPK